MQGGIGHRGILSGGISNGGSDRNPGVASPPDGKWSVRLTLAARELRAVTAGAEKEIPVTDYVTVGVVVDREPLEAGVDPYHLVIDRNHKDNVRDVERR